MLKSSGFKEDEKAAAKFLVSARPRRLLGFPPVYFLNTPREFLATSERERRAGGFFVSTPKFLATADPRSEGPHWQAADAVLCIFTCESTLAFSRSPFRRCNCHA
jgi:hypothetical protein